MQSRRRRGRNQPAGHAQHRAAYGQPRAGPGPAGTGAGGGRHRVYGGLRHPGDEGTGAHGLCRAESGGSHCPQRRREAGGPKLLPAGGPGTGQRTGSGLDRPLRGPGPGLRGADEPGRGLPAAGPKGCAPCRRGLRRGSGDRRRGQPRGPGAHLPCKHPGVRGPHSGGQGPGRGRYRRDLPPLPAPYRPGHGEHGRGFPDEPAPGR